jgi:hypothetical protein
LGKNRDTDNNTGITPPFYGSYLRPGSPRALNDFNSSYSVSNNVYVDQFHSNEVFNKKC